LVGAVALFAGCGAASPGRARSNRELALERAQLEQVSRELSALRGMVEDEVTAARAAWPPIADGLPSTPPSGLRAAVSVANAHAKALPEPAFLANASKLTGPAAGIAGIYESYEQLAQRGWNLTAAAIDAIASRPAAVASFERASSALYIDVIYDAHYDLSLLGKSLVSGYEKLGGPQAFGATLTQTQVNALAEAYSIPGVRLEPHPAGAAKNA
jgi:hypothetical protein